MSPAVVRLFHRPSGGTQVGRGKALLAHKSPRECLQFFSTAPETGSQRLCPPHLSVLWSSACWLGTVLPHKRGRLMDVFPIGTPPVPFWPQTAPPSLGP